MQGTLCSYRGCLEARICLQSNLQGLFGLASILAPFGPFSTGTLSPAVLAHEDALPAQSGAPWVQGVCCKS